MGFQTEMARPFQGKLQMAVIKFNQKELSWYSMRWAHGEGGVFKSWVDEWAVVCCWWLA